MMRIMFFIMGIPMMILSFFEAVDVMPFVSSTSLLVDGNEIVLTEEEQCGLEEQVHLMLQNAHTLPAYGVITHEMFQEQILQGRYISLKFDNVLELSGLPFDELMIKVDQDAQAFDLMRGMKGIFQGRCVHIDLMGSDMKALSTYVDELIAEKEQSNSVQDESSSFQEDELKWDVEQSGEENLTENQTENLETIATKTEHGLNEDGLRAEEILNANDDVLGEVDGQED